METKEKDVEQKKPLALRIVNIALNVLFVCFFILCMVALFVSLTTKTSPDGAARMFGHELRLVVSESMEKSEETDVSGYKIKDIPLHSLIFIETVPEDEAEAQEWYGNLKIGDVLTFRYVYTTQETITHRIVSIEPNDGGGYTISLQGDNKGTADGVLTQVIDTSATDSLNYVIGKVTGKSVALGYVITAVQSPWGIIFIVIVPCLIIIVFEIIRIVGIFSQKKKDAQREEQQRKDDEIAELKRQLAAANAGAAAQEDENLSSDEKTDEDNKR